MSGAVLAAVQTFATAATQPAPVRVNAFDLHDTLVALRCIDVARLYELIGRQADRPDFAAARAEADAAFAGRPHDLDAIYDRLAPALGLDPVARAALQALEQDVRRAQRIPIAENLAAVGHGDIVVAESGLGADETRKALAAAGLDKKFGVITAPSRNAALWSLSGSDVAIAAHTGARGVDIGQAPVGITLRCTSAAAPNPAEDTFLKVGLRDLAELCRELRLTTAAPSAHLRTVQLIQASLNFPMLLLASISLARLVETIGRRKVLFSSRDCDQWLPLFVEVARRLGVSCEAHYFYTSRTTKMRPSPDYRTYAQHCLSGDALLVDICGTGWSLAHLAAQLGLSNLPAFFFHKLPAADAYEAHAPTPSTCLFAAIVPPGTQGVSNSLLEMSNYALHGMVADVRLAGDAVLPAFAADERDATAMAAVRTQQDCFAKGVALLAHHALEQTLQLDDPSIAFLCTALYQNLSQRGELRDIYGASHTREEMAVRRLIGCA